MVEGPLAGKVAIVTGSGSNPGLGRVIVLALIEAGARVAMTDVNPEGLERCANEAREMGGDDAVLPIVADASQLADAERTVQETIDGLGGLHILVNNAGINVISAGLSGERDQKVWEIDPHAWARVIAVNLGGPFLMSRAAIPHLMAQGWGRIIGVTTSLDTMIRGKNTPYGPSKAGHEALISAMAQELDGTGVTANVLIPGGGADTNIIPHEFVQRRDGLIRPEVMAAPAVWLASHASELYTGMRFSGVEWDDSLPLEERIAKAGAPAAWPQLGRSSGSISEREQRLGRR
jgi:3-oxoacyl-[acyl-carrier protein] reductase